MTEVTTIKPTDVYTIVKACGLETQFKERCYDLPVSEDPESISEQGPVYNHSAAINFLKEHRLPTTVEELKEEVIYNFETVIAGKLKYTKGELFIIYPEPIYASGDVNTGKVIIAEALIDFEFPSDIKLQSNRIDDITIALRPYTETGMIKLHTDPGFRMYHSKIEWAFAQRFKNKK